MPKPGFRRNSKTVSQILKTVDGGKRAAADRIMQHLPEEVRAEAEIDVYTTDREVVGIRVRADHQARDGAATRAANKAAGG